MNINNPRFGSLQNYQRELTEPIIELYKSGIQNKKKGTASAQALAIASMKAGTTLLINAAAEAKRQHVRAPTDAEFRKSVRKSCVLAFATTFLVDAVFEAIEALELKGEGGAEERDRLAAAMASAIMRVQVLMGTGLPHSLEVATRDGTTLAAWRGVVDHGTVEGASEAEEQAEGTFNVSIITDSLGDLFQGATYAEDDDALLRIGRETKRLARLALGDSDSC